MRGYRVVADGVAEDEQFLGLGAVSGESWHIAFHLAVQGLGVVASAIEDAVLPGAGRVVAQVFAAFELWAGVWLVVEGHAELDRVVVAVEGGVDVVPPGAVGVGSGGHPVVG